MRTSGVSIRLRLTLWNSAIVIVIMGLASLVVYSFMKSRLESTLKEKLDAGYSMVEDVLVNSGGDIFDIYHLSDALPFILRKAESTVYMTSAWDSLGLPEEYGRDTEEYFTENDRSENPYLLKYGSLPQFGFEIVFAQSSTDYYTDLKNLSTVLIAAVPLVFLMAILGGYFLAGRALKPIQEITHRAGRITAESLSERLPVANPGDELGRLTTVFNQALDRLEEAFERLKRFTSDASHELRTPLTSIRSVGEVALQGDSDPAKYREAISSILEEAERMTRLIDELLLLARGDAGKEHLEFQGTGIVTLVGGVIEDLQILADDKDLKISVNSSSDIETLICPSTIKLALTNVLHNAIRYTPSGKCITVGIRTENGNVEIDVDDEGIGIPENDREKVFERFYRIDKARTRAEGGTGLGLSIAEWAVEANRGKIEFIEKSGKGSCCRITLPLA